jgi:hypothetical protein
MATSTHDIAMRAHIAELLKPLAVAAVERFESATSEHDYNQSAQDVRELKAALDWLAQAETPIGRV